MKYFRLIHNGLNTNETGTQFQSIEGRMGDIQKEFIPFEGKINFDFTLPEPHLEQKAKHTTYINVMMIPSWFLVLKREFIQFLGDFEIDEYQVWNIDVYQNGHAINGYQLFFLCNPKQKECIDFSNSEFYAKKISEPNHVIEPLKIANYQDYLTQRETLSKQKFVISYRKIVIDLTSLRIDFFRIVNAPCSGYYVSQRLKKAIEFKKFTGFAFKEIEDTASGIRVIY